MLPDHHDVPLRKCECGATGHLRQVKRARGGTGALLVARYECPACKKSFAVTSPGRTIGYFVGLGIFVVLGSVAIAVNSTAVGTAMGVFCGVVSLLILLRGGFALRSLVKHPLA